MVALNLKRKPKQLSRYTPLLTLALFVIASSILWYNSNGAYTSQIKTKEAIKQLSKLQTNQTDQSRDNRREVECSESHSAEKNFRDFGLSTNTDKVKGPDELVKCLANAKKCVREAVNPKCRTGKNHFYHTLYQKWLGPYSTNNVDPFQFLEIGYYHGDGYDTYSKFLPRAEGHSMEISCIEHGPKAEGKWPWGNFAEKNPRYSELKDGKRLHCGDASTYTFLEEVWRTEMKRPNAPPLKLVIDDGAHHAQHMAVSLFFWFPRIEPGGILVVEDIQPIKEANDFRLHVVSQVMKDLHYCGDGKIKDESCFPTIMHLIQSVHCEMHICVFERNSEPSEEPDKEHSMPPPHALDARKCLFGDV